MLRKVFSYLILTNQIQIAEPKIYHHLVFLQEFGVLPGGCLTVKRLQVNYVDLLFCHRPDPFTPTETIVRSMLNIFNNKLNASL